MFGTHVRLFKIMEILQRIKRN